MPVANPQDGDKILVLKQDWLERIFADKTMEVRGRNLAGGPYYLGSSGLIWGRAVLDSGVRIATDEEWVALRGEHRVDTDILPYRKTYGFRIRSVERLGRPMPYTHPRGAIGIVRFRH